MTILVGCLLQFALRTQNTAQVGVIDGIVRITNNILPIQCDRLVKFGSGTSRIVLNAQELGERCVVARGTWKPGYQRTIVFRGPRILFLAPKDSGGIDLRRGIGIELQSLVVFC